MSSKGRPYRKVVIDGFEILIGKGDQENDRLTFELAEPDDLWLHVAEYSGSHVLIRSRAQGEAIPEPVVERAAELAAWFSKGRGARGKVEVHLCRAGDVYKPRGFEPGKVMLQNWSAVRVYPKGLETEGEER
jgi:predicted ribosome quality control (RQC) complex YloA/Tae2 family protein